MIFDVVQPGHGQADGVIPLRRTAASPIRPNGAITPPEAVQPDGREGADDLLGIEAQPAHPVVDVVEHREPLVLQEQRPDDLKQLALRVFQRVHQVGHGYSLLVGSRIA